MKPAPIRGAAEHEIQKKQITMMSPENHPNGKRLIKIARLFPKVGVGVKLEARSKGLRVAAEANEKLRSIPVSIKIRGLRSQLESTSACFLQHHYKQLDVKMLTRLCISICRDGESSPVTATATMSARSKRGRLFPPDRRRDAPLWAAPQLSLLGDPINIQGIDTSGVRFELRNALMLIDQPPTMAPHNIQMVMENIFDRVSGVAHDVSPLDR